MSFMDRLLGRPEPKPAKAAQQAPRQGQQQHSQPSTQNAANSPQSVRKELVRVAGRDTLQHNGIPSEWVRVEPLTMAAPGREPGLHVRIVVLHWDPRLMLHAVALQQNLVKRIALLDPECNKWLMGASWQFDLKDDSDCPPLPHPGSWTAPPPDLSHVTSPMPVGGVADVIEGPTRIPKETNAREDLERMLAERDKDFQKSDHGGFEKTQPMKF
jgi:hypothetical protein